MKDELIKKARSVLARMQAVWDHNADDREHDVSSLLLLLRDCEAVIERYTALCSAIPGLEGVIEGTHVVAPREATDEMIRAGRIARMNIIGGYGGPGPWEAMIEASKTKETGNG